MNKSNPLLPQGSLLEQKSKGRARLRNVVISAVALNVLFLGALLIGGCNKSSPPTDPASDTTKTAPADPGTNVPPANPPGGFMPQTNNYPPTGTNMYGGMPAGSNGLGGTPPGGLTQDPVKPPIQDTPQTSEYVVVKGDTFATIAKKSHVTVKAVEAANPNVDPKKLKVGQKLQLPGSATVSTSSGTSGGGSMAMESSETSSYTVKAGDTLTKVSKHFGITVKAIKDANNLKSNAIKTGQKLKIPGKALAHATQPMDAPTPAFTPTVAPGTPAPGFTPAAAPASTTPGMPGTPR